VRTCRSLFPTLRWPRRQWRAYFLFLRIHLTSLKTKSTTNTYKPKYCAKDSTSPSRRPRKMHRFDAQRRATCEHCSILVFPYFSLRFVLCRQMNHSYLRNGLWKAAAHLLSLHMRSHGKRRIATPTRFVRALCVCVCVMTTQTALYAERSDCCVKWQPTRRAVDISARRTRPFDSCHLWPLSAIFPSSSMRTLGYRSLITSRFNFKHSLLLFSLLFFSFNDLDATFVVHSIAFCAERYKRSCIKDRNDSIR